MLFLRGILILKNANDPALSLEGTPEMPYAYGHDHIEP